LDKQAQEGYDKAFAACYPATPTITPTLPVTPATPEVVTPEVTSYP